MTTAKQNQKFPFHFLSAPPTPPAEENKKGKENFWVLPARVLECGRGAQIRAYDLVSSHHALRAYDYLTLFCAVIIHFARTFFERKLNE